MRKTLTLASILSLMFASIVCLVFFNAGMARANGAPVKVFLSYLPDISNWGPTTATGIADVVLRDGEASLSVVGLPAQAGETYTGWIINTHNGESMNFGRFNTDGSGVGKLNATLPPDIPTDGWNFVLVTVEPNGKTVESPGNRKSIGGFFPEPKSSPAQLPKTGGDTGQEGGRSQMGSGQSGSGITNLTGTTKSSSTDLRPYIIILAAFSVGVIARGRLRRR